MPQPLKTSKRKSKVKRGKRNFKSSGSVTGKTLGRVKAIDFIGGQLPKHRCWIILKALGPSKSTYHHWQYYQTKST
ncbi:hypothetical protein [Lentilactobacillus hilgardii]|uniref:hypothetical protein n=1 Tax=Lentilactobacillus hilgardii TaxID=1588 RepID=UPI00390C8C33